jgi:hypothetical protein
MLTAGDFWESSVGALQSAGIYSVRHSINTKHAANISSAQKQPHREYVRTLRYYSQSQIEEANQDLQNYLLPVLSTAVARFEASVFRLRMTWHHVWFPVNHGVGLLLRDLKVAQIRCQSMKDLRLQLEYLGSSTSSEFEKATRLVEGTISSASHLFSLVNSEFHNQGVFTASRDTGDSLKQAASMKRLSLVAFLLVPFTFISSVFGMNVDVLTGNGVPLSSFIMALAITGACSALTYSVAMAWTERTRGSLPPRFRLKYLWLGLRLGHLLWMIQNGVFLGLLTDSRWGKWIPEEPLKERIRAINGFDKEDVIFHGDWKDVSWKRIMFPHWGKKRHA